MHELDESKEPPVCDLQELFRWRVDLSAILLLEDKKLKKSGFIATENSHMRLKDKKAKRLTEKIELNMNVKEVFKNRNATYQIIPYGNMQPHAKFVIDKIRILDFDMQVRSKLIGKRSGKSKGFRLSTCYIA